MNCRRCNSSNTKFCYYNNYSLSQPRYFCKACRRYWTEGGTLRNVPVGGGSRKNLHKRPIFSNPNNYCPEQPLSKKSFLVSNSSSSSASPPPLYAASHNQNPRLDHQLNLSLINNPYQFGIQNPNLCNRNPLHQYLPAVMPPVSDQAGLLPIPCGFNSPVISDVKTSLGFPIEEINGGFHHNHHQQQQQTNLSSSIEEAKRVPLSNEFGHEGGQVGTGGYWINGMLAGGGSW